MPLLIEQGVLMKFIIIAINHFNLGVVFRNLLIGLILLFGGVVLAQSIYRNTHVDDVCSPIKSVFFPSPDEKWYAKVNTQRCIDSADKTEIFLVRTPNDRIRILVYSATDSVTNMNISWASSEQLIITAPDAATSLFSTQQYAGINVAHAL